MGAAAAAEGASGPALGMAARAHASAAGTQLQTQPLLKQHWGGRALNAACHITVPRPRPPQKLTNHFAGAAPLGSEVDDGRTLADGQVFQGLGKGQEQERRIAHVHGNPRPSRSRHSRAVASGRHRSPLTCAAANLLVLGIRLQLHHLGPACRGTAGELEARERRWRRPVAAAGMACK